MTCRGRVGSPIERWYNRSVQLAGCKSRCEEAGELVAVPVHRCWLRPQLTYMALDSQELPAVQDWVLVVAGSAVEVVHARGEAGQNHAERSTSRW